jgi:hypothetical protein
MMTLEKLEMATRDSPARSSAYENLFCCGFLRDIAEEAVQEVLSVVAHVTHLFVDLVFDVFLIDPEADRRCEKRKKLIFDEKIGDQENVLWRPSTTKTHRHCITPSVDSIIPFIEK